MPCGERCCCVLGGCGCPPEKQRQALASLIIKHTGSDTESAMKAAEEIFDIFGYGPHVERLRELGVSEALINQKDTKGA